MLKSWLIILIVFYFQAQTLMSSVDEMIDSSINTNVQPCADFYSYACGHYNKQTFFNASLNDKSLLDYANHQYNTAVMHLLDEYGRQDNQTGGNCQTLIEKVRNYFESCRKAGKRNLTRYLEELKPGPQLNWPILENKGIAVNKWPHGQDFDILHLLGKLRSLGITSILSVNQMRSRGFVIRPSAGYRLSSFYTSNIIPNMLSAMGVENPAKIIQDIMESETILQNILDNNEQLYEFTVETSFAELVKRYPKLNFQSYFMEYKGKELLPNTSILLASPTFFTQLNDNMWLSFGKTQLCNYLMMQYLVSFGRITEFSDMFCLKDVRKMFNFAVNFLYYKHNTKAHKRLKADVGEMLKIIVDMLTKHLQRHELQLTIYQIESLVEKLRNVRLNIGDFPDNASCNRITKLYSSVPPLDENNFYKNHLLVIRFIEPKYFEAHFEATGIKISSLPTDIYAADLNMITLNYAYLMPPIYDVDYNNLSKHSYLGFILAQQLVEHCKLVENLSFGKISQPFQSALECLKKRANGGNSYFKDRVKNNVASEVIRKIVALKFNIHQPIEAVSSFKKRFFLHVAQHYCSTDNEQNIIRDSPSNHLNRIAMNIEGFAQTFRCPKNSKMHPLEKCQI